MASFVGIVTQQDVSTGLTLRAKVTSPKKTSHAYQDFKCMVKPTGLSDLQCVLLDLATITNNLMAAGVIGIKNNLTRYMPDSGDNGTRVQYQTSENVIEYIDGDGIVKKRPSYGTSDQTGTLRIVVTKGVESAEREINISVAQYTEEEILQNGIAILNWDTIRGANAPENPDNSVDGRSNVMYALNLVNEIETADSITNISVIWKISQDILQTPLGETRINVSTGAVFRPKYTDIIELINGGQLPVGAGGENYTITSLSGQNVIRLSGLRLTAELTLGTSKQVVQFSLKTLSALLTNEEVTTYVVSNVSLTSSTGEQFLSTANNSSMVYTIDELMSIALFTRTSINQIDASGLFGINTSNYRINIGTVSWSMVDSTDQTTPLSIPQYTNGPVQLPDSDFASIEFKALPIDDTEQALSLKCTFETSGYDGGKQNISGYWKFKLKKSPIDE